MFECLKHNIYKSCDWTVHCNISFQLISTKTVEKIESMKDAFVFTWNHLFIYIQNFEINKSFNNYKRQKPNFPVHTRFDLRESNN